MRAPTLQPLASRPTNLTEMVLEALQQAIVDKVLAPGQQVSEATLAESLQVSKTPVREALLRLRHIGLVEPAGRGLRVVRPSASSTRYAYELRAGLERTTSALAAARVSEAEADGIAEAAEASLDHARAGDADGFQRLDQTFHERVAAAARNPLLRGAVDDALVLTRALRARDVPASGDSVVCAEQHLAVSRALAEHDDEAAGRLMHQHVQHVMQIVLAALAQAEET